MTSSFRMSAFETCILTFITPAVQTGFVKEDLYADRYKNGSYKDHNSFC